MTLVLELDRAFDRGTLHTLRAKVLALACRAGLPESRAMDVALAVHELAANAIRHGAGAGRLRIWKLTRELCCQIDDGEVSQTGFSLFSHRGHGLWLVRRVADRVHVMSSPDGTRVQVAFNVS